MKTSIQNKLRPHNKQWLLPILSGLFIGTSYIPFPPWASLFCFVPLWIFWKQQEKIKNVLLGGLLTAFIFTLIGFNWVAHTLHRFKLLFFRYGNNILFNIVIKRSNCYKGIQNLFQCFPVKLS